MLPTTTYSSLARFHAAHTSGLEGSTWKRPTPVSQQNSLWLQQYDVSVLVTLEHEMRSVPPVSAPTLLAFDCDEDVSTHLGNTAGSLETPSCGRCMTRGPRCRLVRGRACWRGMLSPGFGRSRRCVRYRGRRASHPLLLSRWDSSMSGRGRGRSPQTRKGGILPSYGMKMKMKKQEENCRRVITTIRANRWEPGCRGEALPNRVIMEARA